MKALYLFIIFIGILGLTCCKSAYQAVNQKAINFGDYSTYVFRLCEKLNTYGNIRFSLCDTLCNETDVQADDSMQVIEELYALQHDIDSTKIIYFTSKSYRDIREDRGIFNDSSYRNYIFVNDFEYVYFGTLEVLTDRPRDTLMISFLAPDEILSFRLKQVDEDCRFLVDSIHSDTSEKNVISNKKISMLDLFSVGIQFIKTDRVFAYRGKGRKERGEITFVSTLDFVGRKLNFKDVSGTVLTNLSQKRRLKYHPGFGKMQSDELLKSHTHR